MSKCLYCYHELEEGQVDLHPICARKFFGSKIEQMRKHLPKWKELICQSFLPEQMKVDYCSLLDKRNSALDVIK